MQQPQATFREELKERASSVRDYGMYIALILIFIVFEIATKGLFLSSRNIANLVTSTSYTAIIAIGMTLVIVIRHIDLSVGYLAGALGAVAGLALQSWGFSVIPTILVVLVFGLAAGLLTGTLVAQLRIPAFVATLAGWLFYRGVLQLLTRTGTIVIEDSRFNAIGNGFIPDIPHHGTLGGVHLVTMILGLLTIIAFVWGQVSKRRHAMSFGFRVEGIAGFTVRVVIVCLVIAGITWILAGYQGLSWAALILAIIAAFYSYVTNRTTIGRHIYAVGGNPEAAQLNGISVKKITFLVFCSMGFLTGVGGIIYASWLRSATTIAGQGLELDVIAAAFVGGVAVSGGVGKVTGAIVGALVMASLTNGMNLLGFDISIQYIVRALVLAAAVIFDVQTRRKK